MADIVIRGVEVSESLDIIKMGNKVVYSTNNGMTWKDAAGFVVLTEGHGRMIDADAPIRVVYNDGTIHETTPSRLLCKHSLLDLPKTIVPAEAEVKEDV